MAVHALRDRIDAQDMKMLPRREIGRTGWTVPVIGLGCAGLPADDDAAAFKLMSAAIEQGVDFFDTADLYGMGLNEEVIGRFIKTISRDKVIIGTKFGSLPAPPGGMPGVDNRPEHIARAIDASLKRLNTDYVDLYYIHRRDPSVPIEDSVGAMSRLVEAGKVRALGLSEVAAETLRAAHAVHPIAAVQSEYSLWHRDVENDVLPMCRQLGVTLVPFSPLGRSFLTGKLSESGVGTQLRDSLPRFQPDALTSNQKLVDRMTEFARSRQVSTAQVALAWLLAQNDGETSVVPIPGTRRVAYFMDNIGALDVHLQPEDVSMLAQLFAPDAIVGERYSAVEAARAGL
jgi:aryl-alcohol dehydrogenase-like predicted oxidoreductase